MGDPHIYLAAPGVPPYTFNCMVSGYVPFIYSSTYGLKVQVEQRRLFTGEDPASNFGIDLTSPLLDHLSVENGLFTIGTNQYTRTTLLEAAASTNYLGLGYKIYQSQTGSGIVIELLPYRTTIQLNFWNFCTDSGCTATITFFDIIAFVPNTLLVDSGHCYYTSTCPSTGSSNPSMLGNTVLMSQQGLLGYRSKDTPAITDALIQQVCGGLAAISTFFYNACVYDVTGAQNPNVANVIISNVNTVVAILRQQNILQNFSAIVNTTALNITASGTGTIVVVPTNPPVSGFALVTTNDVTHLPSSSSSSSSTGQQVSIGCHVQPHFFLSVIAILTITWNSRVCVFNKT